MDIGRDYGQDHELIKQFFKDFSETDSETGEIYPKYAKILTDVANREAVRLTIDLADLEQFNEDLTRELIRNTCRYNQIFHDVVDEILLSYRTKEIEYTEPMDIFIKHRLLTAEKNRQRHISAGTSQQSANPTNRTGTTVDIEGEYPPDLIRREEIYFKPTNLQATPIREVKAAQIGTLVTIRGVVTKTTDVKPKITIATYTCDQCGCESFQPIQHSEFTPLLECSSSVCKSNASLGRITLQTRGSKFVKAQAIKLQEHSDQVPTGHIPRTITIMVYGELTRCCAPGDHISVSGVFLPVDKSGFRLKSSGLSADTFIKAHYVTQMTKTDDDQLDNEPLSIQEAEQLASGSTNFLAKLSSSIAPEIYGHEELKKALLLLLVGGVDKNPMGMKIRGNINICLMGDPGVAKSQLLSFIDRLAARSQYTTGKGSSGVGLTAAVLKDPITNELVLEGGALVLADQGICCIDEFDKMADADRTAIHEVMEQQTVSIAKAGIMTTLNARVSILAAANPAFGRYDVKRTITDNLELPPALLSRFDLLWLIKDRPDRGRDLDLAQHITHIHSFPNDPSPNDHGAIDMKTMRRYVALCKRKDPVIPRNLTDRLVKIYLDIRARKRSNSTEDSMFTSPRSLLAILRLTTALARLRLADEVEEADIAAAVDLYNASRESIEEPLKTSTTVQSQVLDLLKMMRAGSKDPNLLLSDVREKVAQELEISVEQLGKALDLLSELELVTIDREMITLVD